MAQANIQSTGSRKRTCDVKQSAAISPRSNHCRAAASVTPPTMIGVGSPAPISKRYTSIQRLKYEAQQVAYQSFFSEYTDALVSAFNLGVIDDSDLAPILAVECPLGRIDAAVKLINGLSERANMKLKSILSEAKQKMVAKGVPTELVEQAVLKSEVEFTFVFNQASTKLAFAVPSESDPIFYDFAALGEAAPAASALLGVATPNAVGGYLEDVYAASIGEIPTIAAADRDAWQGVYDQLMADHSECSELPVEPLISAIEAIYEADWFDDVYEMLQWRSEVFFSDDFFSDISGNIKKLNHHQLDESYSVISTLIGELLTLAEMGALLNDPTQFDSLNTQSGAHADLLQGLHDSINTTELTWPDLISDSWGLPYIHIPCRFEDVNEYATEILDSAIRGAWEAGEMVDTYDLNVLEQPWQFIQSMIENSLVLAALHQYCSNMREQSPR